MHAEGTRCSYLVALVLAQRYQDETLFKLVHSLMVDDAAPVHALDKRLELGLERLHGFLFTPLSWQNAMGPGSV